MKQLTKNSNQCAAMLVSLGVALILLYAWSGPKGTTPEDASEFILTAFFKGIPHPPGYPLFVWLGHLCSYLPWGSPAQKIAFLSQFCVAGSAMIWGLWVFSLFRNTLLAAWTTLTFGLSLPLWSSGQLVEVYPLHTFLLTLTFFWAFQISSSESSAPKKSSLFLLGLFGGFSLANHYPLVVLALPAFLVLLFPKRKTLFKPSHLLVISAGLFLGLLPYLHLWIAHRHSDFLFSGPIENTPAFLDYVLRKEYAQNDRSKVFSIREFGLYSWTALKMLFEAFTPLVFLAAFLGGTRLFREKNKSGLPLALLLGVCSSLFFLFLFWQPDYYRLAIELYETFHGFALGCFLLFSVSALWFSFFKNQDSPVFYYLLFLIPVFLLISNFKALDRRKDTFTQDYASMVLDSLPQNSLLLVKGDADAGILAYAHFLEKKRPDIFLVSQVAALLPKKPFDRGRDIPNNQHQVALLNLISAHLALKHPVFSIGPVEYFSPKTSPFPLKSRNYGLFREVYENEPAPQRYFPDLISQEASFLDSVLQRSFDPNFAHYRDRIISDVCHGLLIAGNDHPAFEVIPKCQLLKAQWLHVEKGDYEAADKFFLSAIKGSKLAQNSELAEMGKDFLLNRIKLLELKKDLDPQARRALIEETLRETLPLALDFKTCKNNLAPKIFQLALSSGFPDEAQTIQNAFRDCGL